MYCNVNNTQTLLTSIFSSNTNGGGGWSNLLQSGIGSSYGLGLMSSSANSFGRFTNFKTNYRYKGTDIADLCAIKYSMYDTAGNYNCDNIPNNYTIRGILIGGGGGGGGGAKTNNANASRTNGGSGGGGAVNIFEYKNTSGTTITQVALTIGGGGAGGQASPWDDHNGYSGAQGGNTSLTFGARTYTAGYGGGGGNGYLASGDPWNGVNGLSNNNIVGGFFPPSSTKWGGTNNTTQSSYMINQPLDTRFPNYNCLMGFLWGVPGGGGWSEYRNAANGYSGYTGAALIYIFYDN